MERARTATLRDFVGEMRAVIEAATSNAPYVSRVVAAEIVGKLRADDPDLLTGWLDLQAEQMVHAAINERDRSARASARANVGRTRFRDAADQADLGDLGPLRRLLDMPFVVQSGQRLPLGRMTGYDCGYVAESYESTARRARMHAALLRALEDRIGGERVEEHFSEEQLRDLWTSFSA